MRRIALVIVCLSFLTSVYSQGDIDALEKAITQKDYKVSDALSRKMMQSEISLERAYAFWAVGVGKLSNNPDSANYYLELALSESPDDLLYLKIMNARANYYDITGQTRKSITAFLQIRELAKANDPLFLAGIYNNLCIGYRELEKFDSAIHYGFEGLKVAEKEGLKFEMKRLLNSIAISFAVQGDLESASGYFRRSLQQAIQNEDSTGASKGYTNLTQVKIYEEQLDSAEYFLNLAERFNRRNKNALDIMDMYSLLAEVKLSQDEALSAIRYLDKALEAIEEVNYPMEKVAILFVQTSGYLKIDDPSNAQRILNRAIEILQSTDATSEWLEANTLQRDIYLASGKYREATGLQNTIDSLTRIRFDEDKVKAVTDTRTKYETEKKEQQIVSLEQQTEIANLKIQQQNLLLIVVSGLAFLLIIAGYFFYRNRTLLLAQQRLIIEQQLLRSQMNPHFLFNALSSIHSFIFKGDKREAAEYLTTFSELTRDILDHSAKEWITLQKELTTLERYMQVQQLRFPKVTFEIITGELETKDLLVPPMLLQPFAENAFEHGFSDQTEGQIEVRIHENGDQLLFEIEDSGRGLGASKSQHESKAIRIAQERLSILFGKNRFTISIADRKDINGVLVSIAIPKEELI